MNGKWGGFYTDGAKWLVCIKLISVNLWQWLYKNTDQVSESLVNEPHTAGTFFLTQWDMYYVIIYLQNATHTERVFATLT